MIRPTVSGRQVALLLVIGVLITACDATTTPTSVPGTSPGASQAVAGSPAAPSTGVDQPSQAVSPAPSGSPVAMTLAEAKAAYKAIAGRYNKVLRTAQKRYKNVTTLSGTRRFWAIIAKADGRFTREIKALVWPDEVATDIRSLIRANVVVTRSELQASKAKTWAAMYDIQARIHRQDDKVTDLAALVRDTLGLPPNS